MSKSIVRRLHDPNFITKYFCGDGIDIGGMPDPLELYLELFPLCRSARIWDLSDGDAQYMKTVSSESFDFVVSSHCLEHLLDPKEGIRNWFRIIKPGGHLIITIPDEDLYEQGVWPSTNNLDHKHTFTILKNSSWSPNSINIFDLIADLGFECDIRKIEVLDSTYRYSLPRYDQTATPVGEAAIEIILRKRTQQEINNRTNRIASGTQPSPTIRKYFNQYRDDYLNLKKSNSTNPPFQNDGELK